MHSSAEMFKKSVGARFWMTYTGRELIDSMSGRGWNLYDSTDTQGDSADGNRIIMRGPAEKLQIGKRYVLLPICDDPRTPARVFGALERIAVKLKRKMPTIEIEGVRHSVTGFRIIKADEVKVNTPDGERYLPYNAAIAAARTLFNTKTLRYD